MGEGGWRGLGKDEIRWCGYLEAERVGVLKTTDSTSGAIVWVGPNGLLQSNSSNLYWDNTNKRLGIGTSVPKESFEIDSSNGDGILLRSTTAGNNQDQLGIEFQTTGGTTGAIVKGYRASASNNVGLRLGTSSDQNLIVLTPVTNLVGIGTEIPSERLEISGGNFVLSNTTPVIEMKESDQTLPAGLFRFIGATDRFLLQRNTDVNGAFATSDDLIEAQADGDLILLGEATGKVGISVTSPAKTLQVNGTLSVSGGATAQYFVNASGGITANVTSGDLVGKAMLFSGGLLVGYG